MHFFFFCICLAPQSQAIFAFQWESSSNGEKGQMAWIQLPQVFKNSPTIFGTALASDLKAFLTKQHGCTLLQYVDDLLLAGPTQEDCMEGTCLLLSVLWKAGYNFPKESSDFPRYCQIPRVSPITRAI
jgi:hypothetical protein